MAFDFAAIKAQARQLVHDTFAVSALFQYDSSSVPIEVTARFHNRLVKQGLVENAGAEVYENIDQVIFNVDVLSQIGLIPSRGNLVTFPAYQDLTVVLDYKMPNTGPVEEVWTVTRQ